MEPFNIGDKVNENWERYELCPVCGQKASLRGR